ncbi:hypothetical protein D9758_018309 [Tetrapyrgos nigripes]|uniref:Uncharacterized protein n=1 Tax=Tetrapyrgos nigripes TaxID=182062 RepID=A0A8H5BDQ4_9AGAR|nr:hypothetical protein D9758_018309 [Tetrapyrgos nigripes]
MDSISTFGLSHHSLESQDGVKKKASVDSFNVEASGDGEDLKLPVRVAQDIAAFVRDKKINAGCSSDGKREIWRSECFHESYHYGINKLWRTALLTASRNLRQNVLRGRIWGFEDESNPGPVFSPSILSPVPSVATTPFSSVRGIGGLEEMAADDEEQDDESTPNKNTVNTGSTRRPLPTPGSSPSVSANTSPNALAVPMQTGSAASSRNNTMSKSGNRHAFVTGTNPSNAGSVRVRGVSGLLDDFSESQFNGGEKAINLLGDDEDEDGDTHARTGTGSVRFKHTRIPSDHPNFPNGLPTYSSSEGGSGSSASENSSGSERSSSPENANAMDGRQSSPSSPAVLTKKNRGGKSLRVKAKAGKARPSSDMMLGMQVEEGGGRKGTKGE